MKRLALLSLLAVPLLLACPPPGAGGADGGPDGGPDGGLADAGRDAGAPGPDGGGAPGGGGADGGAAGPAADAGPALPELALTRVLPPRGPLTGGGVVSLVGSGFVRGAGPSALEARRTTSLRFGQNPAQEFQLVDDTSIDVRPPPGVAGTVDVTLTNARGTAVCRGCFTYYEELGLRSLQPASGPEAGGNTVTLTGAGFTDGALEAGGVAVLFRTTLPDGQTVSRRSPAVTRVSSTELRAEVPRGVGGERVDVVAFNRDGVGLLRRAYRYVPAPRVAELGVEAAPGGALQPFAPAGGGAVSVVLRGSGLAEAGTTVSFGAQAASAPVALGGGAVRVSVPAAAAAGAVDVTVRQGGAGGPAWTVRRGFAWVDAGAAAPALHAALPRLHPLAGGTPLLLVGEGLGAAERVWLGAEARTRAAGQLEPVGPHAVRVLAVPPAALAAPPDGASQVEVRAEVGAAVLSLADGLAYRLEARALDVAQGPAAGGTRVALAGALLPPDAQVTVGARAAEGLAVEGPSRLSFTTPPGATGEPSGVWVRSAADPENEAQLAPGFAYQAPRVAVGRLSAPRGAVAGNTLLTLFGEGFGEDTLVDFGAWRAKDVKVLDAHSLTLRIPRAEVGTVDVRATRIYQGSARAPTTDVAPGAFSFFDPRNLSGGLSGGPLAGTLNVTVLNGSDGAYGQPVPLVRVLAGTDASSPLQGTTDRRGQVTLSDPSLVKPESVTVFGEGLTGFVTVAGVSAQNLTVFVIPDVSGDPADGDGGATPQPGYISGRVTGFKALRPPGPGEKQEARVFVALQSPFWAMPFGEPLEGAVVGQDGGRFVLAAWPGTVAIYAVFGLAGPGGFTPQLMGVRRGVVVRPQETAREQDVALDMYLEVSAPVTLQGPVLTPQGLPAPTALFSWLDLGAEGYVPHPLNDEPGAAGAGAVVVEGERGVYPRLPHVDGAHVLFLASATTASGSSVLFRRQPGELEGGVSIPPMLQVPVLTAPGGGVSLSAAGRVAWAAPEGPPPDVHRVTLAGVRGWTLVVPGADSQVVLPPVALSLWRRLSLGGGKAAASVVSARVPRFRYDQWSNESLSQSAWSGAARGELSGGFEP
jgi:hypothetical protein